MFRIQNKELDLLAAYNRKEGPSKSSKAVSYTHLDVYKRQRNHKYYLLP